MRWLLAAERRRGNVVILDVEAAVEVCDIDTELPAHVSRLVQEGCDKLLLNLERVGSMDSSGLGGLLRAYTHVTKRGGELKLVNVGPRVRGVLETTRLITVLQVFETEDEALASFPTTSSSQ